MTVVFNPIRMCRWSYLMVVYVCHSDEVMREADANETSGVLWVNLYLRLQSWKY